MNKMIHSDKNREKLPDNFDASEPLRDPRYERFAHLRVIGVPCAIAAVEAGFVAKTGKPMLPGNAARLDKHPQIVARKVFLAGHETAVTRETRGFVRNQLMSIASLDLLRDFAVLGEAKVLGKRVARVIGIDWKALQASENSSAIAAFKFDRETGVMVEFTRDDKLQALAQLRDMYGLKAPRRTELTGKDGSPIESALKTRYEISDVPMSDEEWSKQYAPEEAKP
jgi:hypothetical protein